MGGLLEEWYGKWGLEGERGSRYKKDWWRGNAEREGTIGGEKKESVVFNQGEVRLLHDFVHIISITMLFYDSKIQYRLPII